MLFAISFHFSAVGMWKKKHDCFITTRDKWRFAWIDLDIYTQRKYCGLSTKHTVRNISLKFFLDVMILASSIYLENSTDLFYSDIKKKHRCACFRGNLFSFFFPVPMNKNTFIFQYKDMSLRLEWTCLLCVYIFEKLIMWQNFLHFSNPLSDILFACEPPASLSFLTSQVQFSTFDVIPLSTRRTVNIFIEILFFLSSFAYRICGCA